MSKCQQLLKPGGRGFLARARHNLGFAGHRSSAATSQPTAVTPDRPHATHEGAPLCAGSASFVDTETGISHSIQVSSNSPLFKKIFQLFKNVKTIPGLWAIQGTGSRLDLASSCM